MPTVFYPPGNMLTNRLLPTSGCDLPQRKQRNRTGPVVTGQPRFLRLVKFNYDMRATMMVPQVVKKIWPNAAVQE